MKCDKCKEYVQYTKALSIKLPAFSPTKDQVVRWIRNYHKANHPDHDKKIIG